MEPFSVRHIDYLEGRISAASDTIARASSTEAAPECRRSLRITRVGRIEPTSVADSKETRMPPSADLLIGMNAYKIPLSFQLGRDARGVAVRLGVWSSDRRAGTSGGPLDAWIDVLSSLLDGIYPTVEAEAELVDRGKRAAAGALALGIPSFKTKEGFSGMLPVDRLIRAMAQVGTAGEEWSVLLLAEPVDEFAIESIRADLLSEFLETRAESESARTQNPIIDYYMRLLDIATARAIQGLADGAWRVAPYLLGAPRALARLASCWKSVFQGENSVPQPIMLHWLSEAPEIAARWAMPDVAAPQGPGIYSHPFAWQSLLTSRELAAYVHLPARETKGLAVRPVTFFNVVAAAPPEETSVPIGEICELRRPVGPGYRIALKDLCRHGLIVGMTGSGKTNTVKGLLAQLDTRGVPFLVIEPAKKEYRDLLAARQFHDRLAVWTIGDETAAPLRLNPFEFEPGTPVASHIDLLKSLFTASFGLWTPLPQILERCLHEVYEDCGWMIATSVNRRLAGLADAPAFPTLAELVAKVDTVTESLGYHGEFTSNARAALLTRLNSLRTGGKGRMLDIRRGVPLSLLLDRPTIVELEDIGDDDDKAFFIGLVLLQLAEHRRIGQPSPGLRHLIVFEEAHRLFSRAGPKLGDEQASPRAKAVETFANMLAEVRAYGQGVLIADQSPTKLAQDVIKNTGLKLCHRLVDGDERATMAAAMAMNPQQANALSTLRANLGEAVVFGEGDETPLFLRVPFFAPEPHEPAEVEADIAGRWRDRLRTDELEPYFLTLETCATYCHPINKSCAEESRTADSPLVAEALESLVLSLAVAGRAEAALAATELLIQVIARRVNIARGTGTDPQVRLRCVLSHAAHRLLETRGRDHGWDYATTAELRNALLFAMSAFFSGRVGAAAPALHDFGVRYLAACPGPGPFPQCADICGASCLFRPAVRGRKLPESRNDELAAAIRALASDALLAAERFAAVATKGSDGLLSAGAGAIATWRAGACCVLHEIDALEAYRWDEKAAAAEMFLKLVAVPKEDES